MTILEITKRLLDIRDEYGEDFEVYVTKGQGKSSFATVEDISVLEHNDPNKKLIVWIK